MRHWTAERLRSQRDSIWEEMNALSKTYNAVNLGSGTPDMPVPDVMQTALEAAVATGRNQYSPVIGELLLRKAVAEHAARFYGQEVDPSREISITTGVTEALNAVVLSVINPGDEVIVFEPFYDCYVPSIRLAGGIPRAVTLHAPTFRFDPDELRAAFSTRTKAIIVNSPHNPTGTVFSRSELTFIANLCQEFDILAITDEVYEHIVFDGSTHIRLATLPGMRERTLTLSGAGKTFSCTGWRIGWAIGPALLQEALCLLRQFTVFAAATPLQLAVAGALSAPDSYYRELASNYEFKRNFMIETLASCGLKPNTPAGSFFILTDVSTLGATNGRDFCHDLAKNFGVVPVPTDTFYLNENLGETLVRFTFCLRRERLETAASRLAKLMPMCGVVR